MSNTRRGRHYRVAQREVETQKALENAYVDASVINVKHAALAFAVASIVFVYGVIVGHFLGNND